MQPLNSLVLPQQNIKGALAIWLFMGVVMPSRVANFEFRHSTESEGLTISFSRSAPPLAALEDERLPMVKTEPALPLVIENGSRLIAAGHGSVWPSLVKYQRSFEKRDRARLKLEQLEQIKFNKMLARAQKAAQKITGWTPPVSKTPILPKIGDLKKLLPPSKTLQATYIAKNQKLVAPKLNLRQQVEAPLTAPSVPRGLPRGEEIKPTPILSEKLETVSVKTSAQPKGSLEVLIPKSSEKRGAKPSFDDVAQNSIQSPAVWAAPTPAPAKISKQPIFVGQAQPTSSAPAPVTTQTRYAKHDHPETDFLTDGLDSLQRKSLGAGEKILDTQAPTPTQQLQDEFKLVGQIELAGGLAVTQNMNKLDILWRAGDQIRQAAIDYSTGAFVISVPHLGQSKVVATLKDDHQTLIGTGEYDVEEVSHPGQKTLEGVTLIIEPLKGEMGGRVISAYSVEKIVIPSPGAEVFGPASTRVGTDSNGRFKISTLTKSSSMILDTYTADHWGTRVLQEGGRLGQIPVFHNKMMQSFLDISGEPANNTELGVVWGEVKRKGKPVAGVKVNLSTEEAIGPIYFNALRIPDRRMTETSENGLFAFIKVKPGLHVVGAQFQNRDLPSSVVSVSQMMVSHTQILFKSIRLKGRTIDPLEQKLVASQLSVVGTRVNARADGGVFDFKVPSSDPIVFIDAHMGDDYHVSREATPRSLAQNVDILAVKKSWLADQLKNITSRSVDTQKSTLVGYVKGPVYHVSLDSERGYSDQNIFYFNENNRLEDGRADGVAGGGYFVMTNLPPGQHTLVITSADGSLNTSRVFVSQPDVLNTVSLNLIP